MKGRFAGINNAEVYKGGRYIVPGVWQLEITQLKAFASTQKAGRHYFAAEFKKRHEDFLRRYADLRKAVNDRAVSS